MSPAWATASAPGSRASAARASRPGAPSLNTVRLLALGVIALASAACASEAALDATPTPTPAAAPTRTAAPTATEVDLGPPSPELERILEHIRVLSEEIGAREAGSPEQDATVTYLRDQLERWGYHVELQEFPAEGPLPLRHTTLSANGRDIDAIAFASSGAGEARGPLVDAGTGQEADFTTEAEGAVVLIQRQDVFFVDMAQRARDAGAAGAIVTNKEPGPFVGALDPPVGLPMVSVSQSDGEALRELLADGPVDVEISVADEVSGRNVVALPDAGVCRTLSGGHHDSVPWADGATDNASGVAVVLELARASAAARLPDACFALFGAEEVGLIGSRFLVSQLDAGERDALEAVYNYDVVAGTSPVGLIGEGGLGDAAGALADEIGVVARSARQPENAGSDHLSFLDEGLPALMLSVSGGVEIHTPEDTFANLVADSLVSVAELGFALLSEPAATLLAPSG